MVVRLRHEEGCLTCDDVKPPPNPSYLIKYAAKCHDVRFCKLCDIPYSIIITNYVKICQHWDRT